MVDLVQAESNISDNKNKRNKYDLSGEYGIGWTSNTNNEFYFDLEDFDKIKDYTWHEHTPVNGYKVLRAHDHNTKNKVKFWWVILGKNCDHKNHNTFDNRKENLRPCTQKENLQNTGKRSDNTSGVVGVSLHKQTGKWLAYLNKDGKRIYTSSLCKTKDEAIRLRLIAEQKYFGEFAPQKHLYEQYNAILTDGGEL